MEKLTKKITKIRKRTVKIIQFHLISNKQNKISKLKLIISQIINITGTVHNKNSLSSKEINQALAYFGIDFYLEYTYDQTQG